MTVTDSAGRRTSWRSACFSWPMAGPPSVLLNTHATAMPAEKRSSTHCFYEGRWGRFPDFSVPKSPTRPADGTAALTRGRLDAEHGEPAERRFHRAFAFADRLLGAIEIEQADVR